MGGSGKPRAVKQRGTSSLLEHLFNAYERFIKKIPVLIKTHFFSDGIKLGEEQASPVVVEDACLMPAASLGQECYASRFPYQRQIVLTCKVQNQVHCDKLLGAIPALTSRGSLLFGPTPVRERVAITQLRLKPEIHLARVLRAMERAGATSESRNKLLAKFNKLHKTQWTHKQLQALDISPRLENYVARSLDDLLSIAVQRALKRISGYFARYPCKSLEELQSLLFPSLPQMFTVLVERNLTRSGLVQVLDKTNPLAEVAHKRKVTFCGQGGLTNLHRDGILERDIDNSQRGKLCPVETPQSDRIGLNLHLALGATVREEKIQASQGKSNDSFLGVSANLIPFVEHDDMNRALMGAQNMKQALPLLHPEPPLVKTGFERQMGLDSRLCLIAEKNGRVCGIGSTELCVHYDGEAQPRHIPLVLTPGAHSGIGSFYRPPSHLAVLCKQAGTVAALHKSQVTVNSSLGKHTYPMSYALPEDWHVAVKLGQSVVQGDALAFRSRISQGDVLVDNACTVNGELALGVNLLVAYMPWYGYNFEDAVVVSSRVVDQGLFTSMHLEKQSEQWSIVRRPLTVGDKLSGRHGNKGVVSLILHEDRMPRLADGTPIDVLLNPHGVISRMNLGQLLETHRGWIAKKTGKSYEAPPFSGKGDWLQLQKVLEECNLPDGKTQVNWLNGQGRSCKAQVTVGYQYLMKLNHCAAEKLHARSTGPRTQITLQPPKGKKRVGGQRVGEMEIWALQAHQAHFNLEEILTVKSDLLPRRRPQVSAQLDVSNAPTDTLQDVDSLTHRSTSNGFPEAFRVFLLHLRGLGICAKLMHGKEKTARELRPEDPDLSLEPAVPLHLELALASADQVVRWANERQVSEVSLAETVYHCNQCGFTARQGEWKKPGRLKCPTCKGDVETLLAWHHSGLMGRQVFGEHEAQERWQGAYIKLTQAVPHPLFPPKSEKTLENIYVLPPALRPILRGTEGLNYHYRQIIHANNRLRESGESQGSFRWQQLARAVAGLFGRRVSFAKNKVKFSLFDRDSQEWQSSLPARIEGKRGLLRGYLLGKRVDYSGRAVIVPDPTLPFGCCRLPYLAGEHYAAALHGTSSGSRENLQKALVSKRLKDRPLILNRAPSLHRYNMLGFMPDPLRPVGDEPVLAIHPLVCGAFGADFDGDTMAFHLPLSKKAIAETKEKLSADSHLFSVAHGGLLLHIAQDIVSGVYLWTTRQAGRMTLAKLVGDNTLAQRSEPLDKKVLISTISSFLQDSRARDQKQLPAALRKLDLLMGYAFREATEQGLTCSIMDFSKLQLEDSKLRTPGKAKLTSHDLRLKLGLKLLEGLNCLPLDHPVRALVLSGARGEAEQLARLCGAVVGMPNGKPSSCYLKGLNEGEYFEAAKEARKDMMPKKLGTPKGGDLTRKLIYGLYPVRIAAKACDEKQGLELPQELFEHLIGKVAAQDVDGIVKKSDLIDKDTITALREAGRQTLRVFSPVTCQLRAGVCARCYGWDLSTGNLPKKGLPIGILAAQSIGERATQDFMKTFHGVHASVVDKFDDAKTFMEWGSLPTHEGKEASSTIAQLLCWLVQEVYDHKVNLRHFEVMLRQMATKGIWTGMLQLAKSRNEQGDPEHSPLSAAAFQMPVRMLAESAKQQSGDSFLVEPTPLLVCREHGIG